MKFSEVVKQASLLLKDKGQVSYRMLRREFALDDETLEDLKAELIEVDKVAIDEDGKVLVWVGDQRVVSTQLSVVSSSHPLAPQTPNAELPPVSYTPSHLAERIRAVLVTDGERKTITALFADLKGSTALIEHLDPEEARAIIDPALQLMMDAVHQYDGFVAQALGDGIFALFGAPLAHEDHPQRAVYAALRMQETIRRYADAVRQQGYPPLLMRVGINTGEVVLRSIRKDDLHADYVPVGHSTNLAARMEQLATPGTVVVSAYTHRLTDGYFTFKDLGPTQIKGVEEPMHIYEVLGVGQLRTRLQVSASRYGLTRFVGRHSEMEQLNKALEQAKAGHGQIVGVMGEPGLGKSRLFYEFKLLSLGGCLVLEAYSVSHGKATAYLPAIELLKSYFDIKGEDDERKRREKVNGKVLTLDRSLEDTLPYLFALLGIEEQPSPLAQMDAQIRRKRTFEALKKLFLRESLNQPLVLIFEDLHWIDGETQGFLDVLSESVASAKLLLLTNYRPEYRHEWGQKTYYTQLRLAPFGKAEAEEFLDELLGERGFPLPRGERDRERVTENTLHALKQLILDKTQGTPFFMEEIVQELREQGLLTDLRRVGTAHQHIDLHLPTTVQAVLAARIDRLAPDEKALLQQLSVIGRQFPLSLICQVITQPEADLYRVLSSLQHKEFLYEQPAFPESEYIFKHALTQDVAYGTVLQEQRKVLHEQTARAIEALYGTTLPEHYSDLAHHYRRSVNTEKAITYLQLAGQQAVQRSANQEAISHLTAALELLKTSPETPKRNQRELLLQIAVGPLLMATQGFGALAVENTYARAQELCLHVGDTSQLHLVLVGRCWGYLVRAQFQKARKLAEQILDVAMRHQDPALLLEAHCALGLVLFWSGELVSAYEHTKEGIALHNPQQHHSLVFLYGNDPGVVCRDYAAFALWFLGYPDQALREVQAASALAQEMAHPYTLAWALSIDAVLFSLRREYAQVQERADTVALLSAKQGFPTWLALATMWQGCVLAEQGDEAGIAQIRQGVVAFEATGTVNSQTLNRARLVEAYRKVGQVEEGLAAVSEVLALVEQTGECVYEAELYRIKGELTLQSKIQGPKSKVEDEAVSCFQKAIEVAQKQQAKSLELRAVMSLARLWQSQGKPHEARSMLAGVYNWFTEGFDTKDLQEAKELLEELV